MLTNHKRMAVIGLLLNTALLAAACNPATPTVVLAGVTPATVAVTLVPTKPPPTATATVEALPVPDNEVTEVVATGTVVVSELDVCALVTDEEAKTVLRMAPLSKKLDVTEDAGQVLTFCTFLGTGQALVVSVANAGTEAAAREYIEAASQNLEDGATATKEGNLELGSDVYWVTTEDATGYNVAHGPHAFIVSLGGDVTVTDELKAALLTLTKLVGGRLGG